MGLDYSFFLTFPKDRLWEALDGVIAIAEPHLDSTTIHFPDEDRTLPLACSGYQKKDYAHDDPELQFAVSLRFPEDEAILEYVRTRDGADDWRAPPDDAKPSDDAFIDSRFIIDFEPESSLGILRYTGPRPSQHR